MAAPDLGERRDDEDLDAHRIARGQAVGGLLGRRLAHLLDADHLLGAQQCATLAYRRNRCRRCSPAAVRWPRLLEPPLCRSADRDTDIGSEVPLEAHALSGLVDRGIADDQNGYADTIGQVLVLVSASCQ